MINLKDRLLQIIKQVFVFEDNKKDNSIYPINFISYNGKESIANRLSVYGYNYNPPKDTWGLSFSSQGKESTKFVLFYEMDERKKELKPGEIYIQHPKTGSSIYLKEDGDIVINGKNITINAEENINLNSDELTHNGTNIGDDHIHGPGSYTSPSGPVTLCSGEPKDPTSTECIPSPE
jgi:phage gp45-like